MTTQRTCLIVDDSKMIRRVASRILKDLDFQVTEAANGQEALDQCRINMPDAILLDWHMPVMDGFAFLKVLRDVPNGQHPVIVFCTAERSVEKITQALQFGANEYVMKPFDSDIIESKFQLAGLL
ncbi:response regulator receiver protein [Litorimonas taeanensis]|uniref:Response regulator receiver protein n=1 Tax=Litorimonas taeanensis TaxID=568099 RepID=A0A420WDG2_9PROT|nr:response regulator [Litorimonas taeanensis]RKQ69059.1 response regulator receiver protein [Litorimonas taeanensis]